MLGSALICTPSGLSYTQGIMGRNFLFFIFPLFLGGYLPPSMTGKLKFNQKTRQTF
jgi:hypothetical protein